MPLGLTKWVDAWVPLWLSYQDLIDATSTDLAVACLNDDGNTPVADTHATKSVIARAEAKVLSYLSEYGPPPFSEAILTDLGQDPFLGQCALNYAVAFMFDKHPEYVREGKASDVQKRLAYADAEMARVLESRQRPPQVKTPPANVGGTVVDDAPRLYVDGPQGQKNNGDY